jgi:D-sedoheptulose 7-phosphate isomerase
METIDQYLEDLKKTIDGLPRDRIQRVIDILHEARLNKQQVFVMGNGGSASTASHFVCDLAKNTRARSVPNFKVIGLTDNMPIFSALANDDGYENVFADQLASYMQPGDVVIGISTSGNSENVLRAIQLAHSISAKTIGLTGFDSGKLGALVDVNLHVPSDCIEHVEDIHLVLEHLICKALRERGKETGLLDQALSILPGMTVQEESTALD